jgi:hypothetical protein
MHRTIAVLALLLVALPVALAAQVPADAYLDAEAGELVRAARARRVLIDRRIQRYQATAVERISLGLRAGIAERLLFRRETASRIDWTHDTVRVEVLAAREVVPPVKGAPQVPAGLARYVPGIAFDPVDSEMLLRLDSTTIRHPLAAGSEEHYRFRTGDSTVIRLPSGRVVRLRELQVLARRRDPRLITGSFWLDLESHNVVQAFFRLARAYDAERDDDAGDVPGFLKPVRADLDYVAIEYGLWDLRWWLPRSMAAQGLFQAGPIRMPLSFERRYDDYVVEGDTLAAPPPAGFESIETRPCRPPVSFVIQVGTGEPGDTARARRAEEAGARREEERLARRAAQDSAGAARDTAATCDRAFIVTQPDDSVLLKSALLPGDIYGDEQLLDAEQLRRIADRVRAIPSVPWQLERPVVQWGPTGPGLLRYNRVEGASIGARATLALGVMTTDAQLHVATAEPDVFAHVGVSRDGRRLHARAAAYRRLDVADVASRPFSLGSSLGALLLGRDEHDYFRASGAELLFRPAETRTQWFDLRLFAEAQRAVGVNTDFSLPHLFDGDRTFRPNVAADPADQVGGELRLRTSGGLDPESFRWGAELALHGEAGDFRFARPALLLRAGMPLFGRLSLSAEAAGGTAFGTVPAQRLWQLGGGPTLRGYDAAVLRGDTYWRTRTELGMGVPFARLTLLGDAAWAGPRDAVERSRPLRSIGFGLSFLDGLARFDIARAIDAPRSWKLHLQVGAY